MKRIIFFIALLTLFLQSFNTTAQCNIQASICTSGTAGPFTFQNGGQNSFNSSCLDQLSTSQYAFIVLYITQTGNLNLLIQGNGGSGFLDVAVFNVPDNVAPCSAIQSSSNEIMCNYASASGGCNQFGTAFGCSSSVPSVSVTAGQTIMIVVEDWGDGPSTNFTLSLGPPPGAQTGPPNATIDPATLGPFCTTDGLMQVLADNMGGVWSGPGMQANGMFNPQIAGAGIHTINYSIGLAPCNSSSTAQIKVGSVVASDLNVTPCAGGQYSVSGNITILQPPTTGDLVIKDCSGQQTVVASAPFTQGSYSFNLTGLTASGGPCNVKAYFTGSACSHVLNYTKPVCPPGCGFSNMTAIPTGCQGNNTYTLNGSVTFASAPSTGQLVISDCNGNTQTFNAPFTSPQAYSLTGLTPNGQQCVVTAHFTDEPTCTTNKTFTAPSIPVVSAGADISICPGAMATLTASGATSYSWDNNVGNTMTVSLFPTATTTYTVTGTTNGCTATDQVVVTVTPGPTVTTSGDVSICIGDNTTISAGGVSTYNWDNNLGAGASHTVSPLTTTTYSVVGTDANGCLGNAQLTVTVNPLPTITATNVALCEGNSTTITANGATTYSWSPATYLDATTGASVTYTAGQSTTYTITGTDANGCVNTTTVNATSHPNPVTNAGADVTVCQDVEVTLIATGAGFGGTYTWTGGVTNAQPFVPTVGTTTYTVTATNVNGCTGTDDLVVTVEPHPTVSFTAVQDQPCAPVKGVFTNTSATQGTCMWVFDNGVSSNDCGPVEITFGNPGSYGASLQVTSPLGCITTVYQSDLIIVTKKPEASFIPNPVVFELSNPVVHFTNYSSGAVSYEWDFGDNKSSVQTNPTHTYPEEDGGYVVTLVAISASGCTDTTTYSVRSEEDLIFYIPNTFTPDGDEFNQSFSPVFTSGFDPYDYEMIIFNRWGEKVYETHDVTVGWKGTYGTKGEIVQDGTYTWKIEFKTLRNDERKTYTGHVNLMR
jgi:trimeric autotransporter adhesin